MSEDHPSGRPLRRLVSRRRFVVITEAGVRFARECYCSSTSLPGTEIELYGFLLRVLSFGGVLPLDVVRRWSRLEVLRKASGKRFVVVSRSVGILPKKAVEETMKVIWGECPNYIYV
ncbi:MAG: hypothetical protein ACE5L6_05700 [Candidatus Bathyarchaeia archaeon]